MKTKESCGCAHDGTRWLVMCAPHEGETLVLHATAAGDYGQHMKKLGWGPLMPEPSKQSMADARALAMLEQTK